MTSNRWTSKLAALAAVIVSLVSVYLYAVRPWHHAWGATDRELARRWPGDEIVSVPRASVTTTHAITIHAPVERVWPWLVQLGQDRGGFYSYEVLEDLVGCEMTNVDRLVPDYQRWEPGDKLWMYPPHKLEGLGHALLRTLVPGHALGFATRQSGTPASAPYDGSWAFVLEGVDEGTTRLIARGRAGGERSLGWTVFDTFMFEPMHFVMERKMMENIRALAEGGRMSQLSDTLQVGLFSLAFLLMVATVVLVFRMVAWWRPLGVLVAAALTFQVLTFLQPVPGIGLALVLALHLAVWAAWRPECSRKRYIAHPPRPALASDSLR